MEFITWEFLGTLAGLAFGIETLRRHHNNKIEKIVEKQQQHELYCAQTFATKAENNAHYENVFSAIKAVGDRMDQRLDGVTERLDRVIESNSHKPSSRRS